MEDLKNIVSMCKNLTNEQISEIGNKAQKEFGLSGKAKDDLMLLLLSGTEKFQSFIFEQTQIS